MSDSQLLESVISELKLRSGTWPDIAKSTNIPYHTLTKIAYRKTKDPGVKKIEKLANFFRSSPIERRAEERRAEERRVALAS